MKRQGSEKRYYDDEEIYYEFEGKGKWKRIVLTIAFVVFGAFAFLFVVNNTDLLDKAQMITEGNEVSMDKDFATGLRLASLERYDEAIRYFEKVNFNKLSEADQDLVLMTYLYSGNEQKALDLKEEIDEKIISVLLENDDLEKLKELETDSELIKFEIAVLDNDYETIIELKDAKRLEIDARRANAIANAYYQLGQVDEALNFTAFMARGGVNMWVMDDKTIKAEDDGNMNSKGDENGISSLSKIMYFLFGAILTFIAYFIVLNRNNLKQAINEQKTKNKRFGTKKMKKHRKEKIKEETDEEVEKEEVVEEVIEEAGDDDYEEIEIIEYEDGTIEERKIRRKDKEFEEKYSYYYEDE